MKTNKTAYRSAVGIVLAAAFTVRLRGGAHDVNREIAKGRFGATRSAKLLFL